MKRLTTVGLQVLLGLAFLASAILKLIGAADAIREHLQIAPWFWVLTALMEIVGAAGMVVSIKFSRLAAPAGLWIAALMGEPSSPTCGLGIPSHEHGPCRGVPGARAGGGRAACGGWLWVQ